MLLLMLSKCYHLFHWYHHVSKCKSLPIWLQSLVVYHFPALYSIIFYVDCLFWRDCKEQLLSGQKDASFCFLWMDQALINLSNSVHPGSARTWKINFKTSWWFKARIYGHYFDYFMMIIKHSRHPKLCRYGLKISYNDLMFLLSLADSAVSSLKMQDARPKYHMWFSTTSTTSLVWKATYRYWK